MKPRFLDNPPAYTRIKSTMDDPIRYAAAIEHANTKKDILRDALLAVGIGAAVALIWWAVA